MNFVHQAQIDLVHVYHIIGALGLDNHTYTHLSARSPHNPEHLYINAFGLCFEEVTVENLSHGGIYMERSDIHAIFHVHTPAIVAVLALKKVYSLSQWASFL